MSREERIGRLKNRIRTIKGEIAILESCDEIYPRYDVPPSEQCRAFSTLLAMTYKHVAFILENGYVEKNSKHYIYETAMEITLGKGVWDVINRHLK